MVARGETMGKILVESWVFDENDEEQIKKYSKGIAIKFKIERFNPKSSNDDKVLYNFFEKFTLEDFDFIPCIREGLSFESFKDYDVDIAWAIIDSAKTEENANYGFYDIACFLEETTNKSAKDSIKSLIKQNGLIENVVDWVLNNCDEKQKENFLSWIFIHNDNSAPSYQALP